VTINHKFVRRLRGLPRTWREFDRALSILATLRDEGWQASASGVPVDGEGRPSPWYSMPARVWLERRLRVSDRVFEFGAGQSTLWYASRVRSVSSVDHDEAWVRRLRLQLPCNATVDLASPEDYVCALPRLGREFDVVAIDGIARSECAGVAAEWITPGGLIVVDNSDRPESAAGIEALVARGFRHIDFIGFTNGYSTLTCTSVLFHAPERWLGLSAPPHLGW